MAGLPALTSEQLASAGKGENPLEIIQWLEMLEFSLQHASKDQMKKGLKQVLDILLFLLSTPYGKPVRDQIACAFAALFHAAGTAKLSVTIDEFHRLLKSRDDSPSSVQAKLGSISAFGRLHERLGGMMAPFVQEAVVAILKAARSLGTPGRVEMLCALEHMVANTGHLVENNMKDMYKQAKACIGDRSLHVRIAAANLMQAISSQSALIQRSDMDGCIVALCKAFESSTHVVRIVLAETIAAICKKALDQATWKDTKPAKFSTTNGMLAMLETHFVKFAQTPEVRVGVTEAYVLFFQAMGPTWLEQHTGDIVKALLHIVSNPKIMSGHEDALRVRRCVQFIVRTSLGKQLGHKGRTDTLLALCTSVADDMRMVDRPEGPDAPSSWRALTALDAISDLTHIIGNAVNKVADQLLPVILSVALHPSSDVRITAARCLRGLVQAVPSRAADITEQCLTRLATFRSSPAGIHGTAVALAATLTGTAVGELGIPQRLLDKTVSAGANIIQQSTQRKADVTAFLLMKSGWLLLASLVSMGSAALTPHHSTLTDLWTRTIKAFDKSAKLSVRQWELTLEGLIGALSCIEMYLQHCRDIITEDSQRQTVSLVLRAVKVTAHLPPFAKNAEAFTNTKALFRARVFSCLALVPPSLYEERFQRIVPLLVADIALSDHVSLTNRTSMLEHQCHEEDSILLGTTRESDYATVEEQLASLGRGGLGSIANDAYRLLDPNLLKEPTAMLPLAPQVEVLDAAVALFGIIFPLLGSSKQRLQLLEHFLSCIQSAKGAARMQAVQVNIFSAFLCGLKKMAELKLKLGNKKVRVSAHRLILAALHNPDVIVRCAAGEAMGRLGQVTDDTVISDSLRALVDNVQSNASVEARTGNSLAIGCILRYAGGVTASQHLRITIKLLHALSEDSNGDVQTWALHALMLTIDATGFNFHPHVPAVLQLCSDILHRDTGATVQRSAGNVVNALITTLGPEVHMQEKLRRKLQYMLYNLQQSLWPSVQLAGLHGMQKLILFAPSFVRIPEFMPVLKSKLSSQHSLLRHAATAIIKQLIQRDAESVHKSGDGVEKMLFRMLDSEEDPVLRRAIRDSIRGFISSLGAHMPSHWLFMCNHVLSGATQKEDEAAAEQERQAQQDFGRFDNSSTGGNNGFFAGGDSDNDDGDGDGEGQRGDDDIDAKVKVTTTVRTVLPTTWQTKVFAVECVEYLIDVCRQADVEQTTGQNPHFDMQTARASGGDKLVVRLAEVIRTCFIAATSATDELKKAGLEALDLIIRSFADSTDPDMEGNHSILEQFQAQVTSALRPAFSEDTAPTVKYSACMVCASWVSSGVNRDMTDLKRLLNLLVKSLETVKEEPDSGYNERASTMLRLGILQAWASIFNRALAAPSMQHLSQCIKPHLPRLEEYWIEALRDYALVSLPPEYATQIPASGNFYFAGTRSTVIPFYQTTYPDIITAASHLYSSNKDADGSLFFLEVGLCVRSLVSNAATPLLVLSSVTALAKLAAAGGNKLCDAVDIVQEIATVMRHTAHAYGLSGERSKEIAAGVLRTFESLAQPPRADGDDNRSSSSSSSTQAPIAVGPPITDSVDAQESRPVLIALQVCTTVLYLICPDLKQRIAENGAPATTPYGGAPQPAPHVAESDAPLLCALVSCLASLCTAATPEAIHHVLPSALLMLIEVLALPDSTATQHAAKTFQSLVSSLRGKPPAVPFLQSACKRICERSMADGTNTQALLLAVALIVSLSPECAQHAEIQDAVFHAIKSALVATKPAVRARTAKIALRLCTSGPAAMVFMASVGDELVQTVAKAVRNKPTCPEDLDVVQQGILCMEASLRSVPEEAQPQLMAVVLPILVALLTVTPANNLERAVSTAALDSLKRVGPQHPAAFRQVVTEAPQLKTKLEQAMKHSAAQAQQQQQQHRTTQHAAPKIKLTMDFSAFK
ncbi:hypothetical protein PTSG_01820 [Salpingoeca rosetta]|uniref:Uncharacterized protein n=1 Tax=Salpingoeca rosetta (strain ATCC 50818 / BSB-021) TaxID=946362 RepID=F2TZ20_SALR5|nr:uncharacterized protein PTSG_01820 [Salpingoeca rosetta]EGD78844.1 hypothetical protein PTSG_01820 [Salpingoeca rosetta]|eukprot:XP_004997800.1 hypothetical protein PTSG_01820 [Salpingoeca rosetta]